MTFMLCPICRDRVIGGGIEELSQNFTEHLRDNHRMTYLLSPSQTRVVRPSYDAHDKNSVGTRWADPKEGAALVPDSQEVTDFAIKCPFCLAVIRG
jgi:hypothetical protein